MPIDISIDLDEAKEIVKKFLDEALNDRNKTVYIVNEMSDEIAFIPPATETENIPQNNTPDRDSIKVGDMFYYRGGECEVYELSGQTENDITITYDNDTIDFPQPIYENINRDTLLQEGKYLGNALDKAESQIDAQKASTSVQAAPEAENVSHNENDFSEEINGYDNSTKYVIKSTDNADYPCNVRNIQRVDHLLGSTLKKELASAQYKVESTQLKIQQAEKQLSRTFPQLKELEEKREKLKEINDKIAAQQEPPEPPKKGDDCL